MYEFLHFGIHEKAFTTTKNALIPQHLGALPPGPLAGALPPAPPLGHSSQTSFASSTIFWIRHWSTSQSALILLLLQSTI